MPMTRQKPPANAVASRRNFLLGGAGMAAAAALPVAAASAESATGSSPNHNKAVKPMTTITVKDGTQIYYKDWRTGQPVVLSHGWPLTADAWEDQMVFLASHGYRCIAHDRRGRQK